MVHRFDKGDELTFIPKLSKQAYRCILEREFDGDYIGVSIFIPTDLGNNMRLSRKIHIALARENVYIGWEAYHKYK